MKNLFPKVSVFFLLLQSAVISDDLYMKNGILYKNVLVIDTTGTIVNIIRDSIKLKIKLDMIDKIESKEFIPNLKSSREIYSQLKYEEFVKLEHQKNAAVREKERKIVEDSTFQFQQHLDSLQAWRRSVFVAAGYGLPQGMRFELGYNFNSVLTLAFTYGFGDQWTQRPPHGMLGILLLIRYSINSSTTVGYASLMHGTDAPFWPANKYTLFCLGITTPLTPALQLRPEAGVALTSPQGNSIKTDIDYIVGPKEITRFYMNVSFEIDLRQIF